MVDYAPAGRSPSTSTCPARPARITSSSYWLPGSPSAGQKAQPDTRCCAAKHLTTDSLVSSPPCLPTTNQPHNRDRPPAGLKNRTASATIGVGGPPPVELSFVEPILEQTPNIQAALHLPLGSGCGHVR